MVLCLIVQVAMAGVSVASSPWEVLFTVCWVVFAVVTTAMVISVAWILVVYPMWSIHRAVSVRYCCWHTSVVVGTHDAQAAPQSEAQLSAYAPGSTELEIQLVWPQQHNGDEEHVSSVMLSNT